MSAGQDPRSTESREAAAEHGFLALLRHLERHNRDKPRIGRAQRVREQIVRLGQDPFLAFPDSDLAAVDLAAPTPEVRARFLGFFGPHGALPLNTTEEVLSWFETGDAAFVDFTDLFAARFLELFFRAWSDARAITQFDHHTDDRFQKYLMSFIGLSSPAFRNQGPASDATRLRHAALGIGRVKSPVRLCQMLRLHLSANVEIEEMVPSWMDFEADSLTMLGQRGSTLGQDMHLGARTQSIGEKIRLHIRTDSLGSYRRFLPGGIDNQRLRTTILAYLGLAFEIEVVVWLPHNEVLPGKLGENATLGWMACVAPPKGDGENTTLVRGTNYRLDLLDQPQESTKDIQTAA